MSIAGTAAAAATRGKGWEAAENVEVIQCMVRYDLSDEISDSDERWKTVAKEVVRKGEAMNPKKGWTERKPHLIRDHVKEMVSIVRSVSSQYSTTESPVNPPDSKDTDDKPIDVDSHEFIGTFRSYTNKLYDYFLIVRDSDTAAAGGGATKKKSDYGASKWWSSDVMFEARLLCFKFDNKKVLQKAPPVVSKFQAEADAKKTEIEERKRKIAEEESEEKERKKKIVAHLETSSEAIKDMNTCFKDLVNVLRTPDALPRAPPEDRGNQHDNLRLDAVEGKIIDIETSLKEVQSSQTQGFAQIMALLQQRNN